MTRGSGITRRDFGRWLGAGVAGSTLACGDDLATGPARAGSGAAIFEPSPTSLLVSVWSAVTDRARIAVHDDDRVAFEGVVELNAGGTGALDVGGLAPSHAYTITVTSKLGAHIGTYRARTAPTDGDPRPVRLAVSADVDADPAWDSPLVEHALAAEPELYISLGDFPYTDNGPDVAKTVPAYRDRHAQLRTAPHARRLFEGVGIRAIYDDHEFRNDWDASWVILEPERYAAAMQVWDEFFPLRGTTGDVRYRSWRWGLHVECFLLDTRRFRSVNAATDDATKTMLGAAQEAWLLDGLARSTATFKLVLTSVPLDYGAGVDHWAGYKTARARLLDALVGTPGVLFVSADQHFFASQSHAHGVREVQVGPVARGVATVGDHPSSVIARYAEPNIGVLEASADALVVSAIGARGQILHRETFSPTDLTPR